MPAMLYESQTGVGRLSPAVEAGHACEAFDRSEPQNRRRSRAMPAIQKPQTRKEAGMTGAAHRQYGDAMGMNIDVCFFV